MDSIVIDFQTITLPYPVMPRTLYTVICPAISIANSDGFDLMREYTVPRFENLTIQKLYIAPLTQAAILDYSTSVSAIVGLTPSEVLVEMFKSSDINIFYNKGEIPNFADFFDLQRNHDVPAAVVFGPDDVFREMTELNGFTYEEPPISSSYNLLLDAEV